MNVESVLYDVCDIVDDCVFIQTPDTAFLLGKTFNMHITRYDHRHVLATKQGNIMLPYQLETLQRIKLIRNIELLTEYPDLAKYVFSFSGTWLLSRERVQHIACNLCSDIEERQALEARLVDCVKQDINSPDYHTAICFPHVHPMSPVDVILDNEDTEETIYSLKGKRSCLTHR